MNLQALYDLKERLEYSTIAGTGLLQEDFRLKRAADGLAPFAAASPVFSKINTAVNILLEAPVEERSRQLLDLLSLVDAVVYTQGTTGISGDITPINKTTSGKYVAVFYGQLNPLIQALTTKGSGRIEVISNCWKEHPEFFSDFRVLPYVIKALGDSYSDIIDLIYTILSHQGKEIVPLLKEGFEPAGKKEMQRRAMLICDIAGKVENEWYIKVLPKSKKEIRETIIKALGYDKNNENFLFDLYNSERGNAKVAVLYALAKINSSASVEYWKKEIDNNLDVIRCLEGLDTQIAADVSAYAIQNFLDKYFVSGTKKYSIIQQMDLSTCAKALSGKYSKEVHNIWLWIAEQMPEFEGIEFCETKLIEYSLCEVIQMIIIRTILFKPSKEVFALGKYLGEKYPVYFLNCAFLVDLLELSPESVYDKYSSYILSSNIPSKEKEKKKRYCLQILQILNLVNWNKEQKVYSLDFYSGSSRTSDFRKLYKIELEGIDKRWLELLADKSLNEKGDVFDLNYEYRISSPADKILAKITNIDDAK